MDHTSWHLLAAIQFLCHQYCVLVTVGTRQPIYSRLSVQQDCFFCILVIQILESHHCREDRILCLMHCLTRTVEQKS
jgi:hypothetical protein